MRRRISLYIANQRADLSDDGLVLMNYAVTNLTNPTAMRNSWSNEVALPRTPANDAIFGDSFRPDRVAGSGGAGADFNASQRTAFSIFDEAGRILECGYSRLTSVDDNAYKVTLFGGLGELIYNLTTDANGQKRNLASLDFGGGENELDFNITAQAVLDAWARLAGDLTKPDKFDIINFAPCYNGLPDNFDADKAIAAPADVSLPSSQGSYGPSSAGNTLISLPGKVDEWAAKDLRSYLQRPVLNVWKFLQAVADPANNGGWTIDLSAINTPSKFAFRDTWLTRPLLPSQGSFLEQANEVTITEDYTPSASAKLAEIDLSDVPSGAAVSFSGVFRLLPKFAVTPAADTLTNVWVNPNNDIINAIWFAQAVAYDSANNVVGISDVFATWNSLYGDESKLAEIVTNCGYAPTTMPGRTPNYQSTRGQSTWSEVDGEFVPSYGVTDFPLALEATDAAKIVVNVSRYTIDAVNRTHIYSYLVLNGNNNVEYTPDTCALEKRSLSVSVAGAGIRSGAKITKKVLLSAGGTPADYLVSICRAFNLYLVANGETRTAKLMPRRDFFKQTAPTSLLDLTPRVDLSKGRELEPLAFDAKYYTLKLPVVQGSFAKLYEQQVGAPYGCARIDTGYDFDASEKDLLNGSVLKAAVPVLASGPYWNYINNAGAFSPSVFLTPGNKYTLWDSVGNSQDFDIAQPLATGLVYYNNAYPGYDGASSRPEFRDADNKAVDGADVLLFYNGQLTMPFFSVTDDASDMNILNNGTPCWLFLKNATGVNVPEFTRYTRNGSVAEVSLDFLQPREMDIPGGTDFTNIETIYDKEWRYYIQDRLDASTKVLRCRVNLDGLAVGPDLLGRFCHFGGAYWVFSSIKNYSLTTFDPAECELVQVRDPLNYYYSD